jgi:hypothetical protein
MNVKKIQTILLTSSNAIASSFSNAEDEGFVLSNSILNTSNIPV